MNRRQCHQAKDHQIASHFHGPNPFRTSNPRFSHVSSQATPIQAKAYLIITLYCKVRFLSCSWRMYLPA